MVRSRRARKIMIRCPSSGDAVATGFSASSTTDFETMRLEFLMVKCPSCTQRHVWSKCDAFLGGHGLDGSVETSTNDAARRYRQERVV
jgi:transposase-like protein